MAPVNFMFNRLGCITVGLDKSSDTFGGLMDIALENGATDYDEALKLQRPEVAYFWVCCPSFQFLESTSDLTSMLFA